MKDFMFLTLFAAFYLVIILLCQVSAQSPTTTTPSGSPSGGGATNSSFPSLTLDQFGITDPAVRQNLQDIYGTLLGQPECVKKSICVTGNYFHDLPGRDIIFTFLGRYIPQDWGLLYDIFRVSIMYGQNCNIYVCEAPAASQTQTQSPGFLSTLFQQRPAGTAAPPVSSPEEANLNPTKTTEKPPSLPTTPPPFVMDNEIHKQRGQEQGRLGF